MAFVMSEAPQSLSESEADRKATLKDSPITSELHLKSSSSNALSKEVVLRRIRHHKCLNKVRSAFQGLLTTSPEEDAHQKWLDQNDNFSSP